MMRQLRPAIIAAACAFILGACTPPLSEDAAEELSSLATTASSLVGAPAALQATAGRETIENRALCRYLANGAIDFSTSQPQVSDLARQQAAAGTALQGYVAALVAASRGSSLQELREAQATFSEAFASFAAEAGSARAGGVVEAGLPLIDRIGESNRQRRVREIMRDAIDPLFLLEALLKRDAGRVIAQSEEAVAAWDREARCLLRASRTTPGAIERFEAFKARRQEIDRQFAAVRNAPAAVERLRVAHILAVTEPQGFEESISIFIEVLREIDALRDASDAQEKP